MRIHYLHGLWRTSILIAGRLPRIDRMRTGWTTFGRDEAKLDLVLRAASQCRTPLDQYARGKLRGTLLSFAGSPRGRGEAEGFHTPDASTHGHCSALRNARSGPMRKLRAPLPQAASRSLSSRSWCSTPIWLLHPLSWVRRLSFRARASSMLRSPPMGECLSAKAKDNKGPARDFPRPAAGNSNPIAATPRPGVPARSWRTEAPGAKAACGAPKRIARRRLRSTTFYPLRGGFLCATLCFSQRR